jgi:16S rRNA processing protein RimM
MVDYFEIGLINNTHGLKGEVKVRNYSSSTKRFEELSSILISQNNEYISYDIENVRYQKDIVLLKLKGVDTIEEALTLKGKSIFIPRADAPKLEDGTYFIADLLGSEVYEGDTLIGTLTDIFTAGAADVYVIKRKGKEDLLLPGLASVILQTDVENKIIRVVIPDSLR